LFVEPARDDMRGRRALSQIRAKREARVRNPSSSEQMHDPDTFDVSSVDLVVN
jgi:hypothetical protein